MARHLVSIRCVRLLFALLFVVMHAPALATAASTTGAFQRWNPWWLHPTQGTLGIFPISTTAIQIDRDGDGTAESLFLRPTGPQGIPDAALGSLRLTPSRTMVYAFGGTCNNGAGTQVHFYRIPSFGDRLEPIVAGLCIPKGILQFGFYDTGLCAEPNGPGAGLDCTGRLGVSTQRIAWFATNATGFGFFNLVWVDLVTGTVSGPGFDFATDLGFLQVSPSGTQAFLQHDVGLPGETDYRLIDLCPGTLGTVINQGSFPIGNIDAVLEAEVTAASGGTVTIEVTRAPGSAGGPPIPPFDLSDCLDTSGACCFASACFDTGTVQLCSGTFLGAGTACSACPPPPVELACCFADGSPNCDELTATACTGQGGTSQPGVAFCGLANCPAADPVLDLSGPTMAQVGDTVAYSLDYANHGGVTAHNVEIELQLPYGSTFVSATGGGDETAGLVRWVIGELAPAASGTVSVSFSLGCEVAQSSVSLQALISQTFPPDNDGRSYLPSNQIDLEVAPTSSGPLTVSVATVPARVPLRPGDEQTHTVTLSNANGQSIEGVQLGRSSSTTADGFDYGIAAAFDRVVSAAGGVVDTAGARFQWTGDVAAGQNAAINFVSQISSCVPPGVRETQLAFGDAVVAYDACGMELGRSVEPATFAIGQIVDVEIGASNLAPPQRLVSPLRDIGVQVTRPGGLANLSVSFGSAVGQTLPGASISFDLRGFNVTTPPSGPGVSYNAGTRSVDWSGTIPASGVVTIDLSGTLTACRAEINLEGSTSPSCTDIHANSVIAAVPAPPPGPWLASLTARGDPFAPGSFEDQLIQIMPGTPTQVTTMLCVGNEYSTGIGGAPNGDVWVGPYPLYSINPTTLDFQAFDPARLRALGLTTPVDVAVDPVDGTVYVAGSRSVGFSSSASILRYTPSTDTLESYFEDSAYQSIQQLVVDEQGALAALAYTGGQSLLVRIDPGTSPSAQVLYDPASVSLGDVALDRDGSYLVLEGFIGPTALLDVDRVSGATTPIVANLETLFPSVILWNEIEVDAQGDVFVAPGEPGLTRVGRATGSGETLLPITNIGAQAQTLIDLAMVGLPIPEPGDTALAGAALAALVALRRARSKQTRG